MKAIGYNSKGERLEFEIDDDGYLLLYCDYNDLVSLDIPGVILYGVIDISKD